MYQTIAFFILFVGVSFVYADTIKLKNGMIVTGKVVEQSADAVKFDSGIGIIVTYYSDEIDTLQKDAGESSEGSAATPGEVNVDMASFFVEGFQYFESKQNSRAMGDLVNSLGSEAETAHGFDILKQGYANLAQGNTSAAPFNECIEYFLKATQADVKNPRGFIGLGACYGALGKIQEAQQNLKQAEDLYSALGDTESVDKIKGFLAKYAEYYKAKLEH